MQFIRSLSAHSVKLNCFLIVLTLLPMSYSHAAMVGTHEIIQQEQASFDRSQINEHLASQEAQSTLASLGVDASELRARVAHMTPDELKQFNEEVDHIAGGDVHVFAVMVFILILMIVLDRLGTVDFYPDIPSVEYETD